MESANRSSTLHPRHQFFSRTDEKGVDINSFDIKQFISDSSNGFNQGTMCDRVINQGTTDLHQKLSGDKQQSGVYAPQKYNDGVHQAMMSHIGSLNRMTEDRRVDGGSLSNIQCLSSMKDNTIVQSPQAPFSPPYHSQQLYQGSDMNAFGWQQPMPAMYPQHFEIPNMNRPILGRNKSLSSNSQQRPSPAPPELPNYQNYQYYQMMQSIMNHQQQQQQQFGRFPDKQQQQQPINFSGESYNQIPGYGFNQWTLPQLQSYPMGNSLQHQMNGYPYGQPFVGYPNVGDQVNFGGTYCQQYPTQSNDICQTVNSQTSKEARAHPKRKRKVKTDPSSCKKKSSVSNSTLYPNSTFERSSTNASPFLSSFVSSDSSCGTERSTPASSKSKF